MEESRTTHLPLGVRHLRAPGSSAGGRLFRSDSVSRQGGARSSCRRDKSRACGASMPTVGPAVESLSRPSQPPPSGINKAEDERGEGDEDGRHLGGGGRRRSRGGAVCIWEHFLPWLPGASAAWLMIRKSPLDIPLFSIYSLSHSAALKVKGCCGSLLCSRGGAWPRMGIPRKKGVQGAITRVWHSELDRPAPHLPSQGYKTCRRCV